MSNIMVILMQKATIFRKRGYPSVLIKPRGCGLKKNPHVCVNCEE
jgi:hypothetical protein